MREEVEGDRVNVRMRVRRGEVVGGSPSLSERDVPLLSLIVGVVVDEGLRGVASVARNDLAANRSGGHVSEMILGDDAVASRRGGALGANTLGNLSVVRALLERSLVSLEVVLALDVTSRGNVVWVTVKPPSIESRSATMIAMMTREARLCYPRRTEKRNLPRVTADPGGLVVRVDALGSLRGPRRVVVRSSGSDGSGSGGGSGRRRPVGTVGGVIAGGDLGVELNVRARAGTTVRRSAGNNCEKDDGGQLRSPVASPNP